MPRQRCLAVRSRSSHIARATIRRRAPDRLCFTHLDQKRTKLRANREGSAKHNFWKKEIPPILIWKKISVSHGSQAVDHVVRAQERNPTLAAARLQRWALLLAAYQYDIEYRSTAKHGNADCLSRLPIHIDEPDEGVDEVKLINLLQIESLPLNVDHFVKRNKQIRFCR